MSPRTPDHLARLRPAIPPEGLPLGQAAAHLGLSAGQTSSLVTQWREAGKIWVGREAYVRGGGSKLLFTCQAHHAAHAVRAATQRAALVEAARKAKTDRRRARRQARLRASTGRDGALPRNRAACSPAPVKVPGHSGPARAPGEPRITSATRITRAPTPPGRYTPAPGEPLTLGLSALMPGQYPDQPLKEPA